MEDVFIDLGILYEVAKTVSDDFDTVVTNAQGNSDCGLMFSGNNKRIVSVSASNITVYKSDVVKKGLTRTTVPMCFYSQKRQELHGLLSSGLEYEYSEFAKVSAVNVEPYVYNFSTEKLVFGYGTGFLIDGDSGDYGDILKKDKLEQFEFSKEFQKYCEENINLIEERFVGDDAFALVFLNLPLNSTRPIQEDKIGDSLDTRDYAKSEVFQIGFFDKIFEKARAEMAKRDAERGHERRFNNLDDIDNEDEDDYTKPFDNIEEEQVDANGFGTEEQVEE